MKSNSLSWTMMIYIHNIRANYVTIFEYNFFHWFRGSQLLLHDVLFESSALEPSYMVQICLVSTIMSSCSICWYNNYSLCLKDHTFYFNSFCNWNRIIWNVKGKAMHTYRTAAYSAEKIYWLRSKQYGIQKQWLPLSTFYVSKVPITALRVSMTLAIGF